MGSVLVFLSIEQLIHDFLPVAGIGALEAREGFRGIS
jgi:hypothetical protein